MEPLMQGAAGMWAQPLGYVKASARYLPRARDSLYSRRGCDRLRPHGKDVCLRARRGEPRYSLPGQRHHRRLLPLAATLTTEEIFAAFLGEYDEFKSFFHGHTYTGNPLGCAVALANLELVRQGRHSRENAARASRYLQRRLATEFLPLAHVSDVRQWGYMVGIELVEDKSEPKELSAGERIGHKVILKHASAA